MTNKKARLESRPCVRGVHDFDSSRAFKQPSDGAIATFASIAKLIAQ